MLGIKTRGAFFKAAQAGDLKTIKEYLQSNAAKWLAAKDQNFQQAIQCATENGHLAAVKLMLEYAPEKEALGLVISALYTAAISDQLKIIKALATNPAWAKAFNPEKGYWTPLATAIEHDSPDCVKTLLETGLVQVYPKHLVTAVKRSPQIFDMILATGVDPNASYKISETVKTPLFEAVNNIDVLNKLLAAGAKPNQPAIKNSVIKYPLSAAASHGSIETMAALIAHGADVHQMDSDGMTPIIAAIQGQKAEAVKFLLDNGVHEDLTMALHAARQAKSPEIVVLLEERTRPAPPAPKQEIITDDAPTETWTRKGEMEIMRVRTYPAQKLRLTDIFNFADEERVFITENTTLSQQSTSAPQSFASISDNMLEKAAREFKSCGGMVNEALFFKNRPGLVKKGV